MRAPAAALRSIRLAADPCTYRRSPTRACSVGMTYGWPSSSKPRWQKSASSRIASMEARSYTPRCGSRVTRRWSGTSGFAKDLRLLLARERRPLLARIEAPGERVACGLLERAKREPGGDRTADVGARHAGVVLARKPQRQLHPRADLGREQRLVVLPHEPRIAADGGGDPLQRLAHRQRRNRTRR